MREKVTRQRQQTTTFEENGEPKRIRTEVPLLTSLTPNRWAKAAFKKKKKKKKGGGGRGGRVFLADLCRLRFSRTLQGAVNSDSRRRQFWRVLGGHRV